MEAMREVLRGSLGRALRGMEPADRLAAAWTIACGPALAGRGAVVGFESGVLWVEVEEAIWRSQMIAMRGVLARRMSEASGLPVEAIRFNPRQEVCYERC